MKQRYGIYMAMLFLPFVFAGCNKESAVIPDTGERAPIILSATSLTGTAEFQTRAESISGKTIGVAAANSAAATPVYSVDWNDYYLDHVKATGTDTDLNGEKEVVFTPLRYWPFNPAGYLAFVAYSPHYGSGGDTRVSRVGTTNRLKVTAGAANGFPDFLYTEPVGVWNKETAKAAPGRALSLGEFRHAMARLDIRVVLTDMEGDAIPASQFPDPNPLKITKLEVLSGVKSGEFDLIQPVLPKVWTSLDNSGTEQTVRTHISTSTPLTASLPVYTGCFLLPGTQDDCFVSVTIVEADAAGNVMTTIERTEAVSGFSDNSFSPARPAVLEMGKVTLLTVKVKYVSIPDPAPGMMLEAQLVEWDYMGKSQVVIE